MLQSYLRGGMAGESSLQRYMKRECKRLGIYWRKVRFEGVNGCPDTLVIFKGLTALVELKNPNGRGRISAQQERRIKEINDHGVVAEVLETREEVDAFLQRFISQATSGRGPSL